jgi:lipopolysaccharide export system permease protein
LRVFALQAGQLQGVARALSARQSAPGQWSLQGYAESRFGAAGVQSERHDDFELATQVSAEFLGLATADRTQMSVRALRSLVSYLRGNGQDAHSFEFALWSRVAKLVAVFFASLLGLPFVFGSLRSAGAGARAALGLVLGLGYFLLQQMVESGTLAFTLPPLLLAWVPTALLAAVVTALVARLR